MLKISSYLDNQISINAKKKSKECVVYRICADFDGLTKSHYIHAHIREFQTNP